MFKFRLQRVLELRERAERDAATALVSAQEAADAARAAQDRMAQAREEMAARLTTGLAGGASQAEAAPAAPAPSVGELRNLSFLLERLDDRLAAAAADAQAAAHVVSQREDALRAAFRDRRTLHRLKERHHEEWRSAEAAHDRLAMDEIALTRFTQQANGRPAGGVED